MSLAARPVSLPGYGLLVAATCALSAGEGCGRGHVSDLGDLTDSQLVQLYSPRKIEVLPFTKVRSFDEDPIPDGIEVCLRPLDEMGDPVKVYGHFLFELFVWRDASGDRAGERLETWPQSLLSPADQKTFWDRVTSTYTFQLLWEGGRFPSARKYLLKVTFQSPGGVRLFAEYPFEFRVDPSEMRPAASAAP
jgi:hypothetical protein